MILRKCGCGADADIVYFRGFYFVCCSDEFCGNSTATKRYKIEAEAIKAWNERDWADGEPYNATNA